MNKLHMYGTKQVYLQLDNALQFRVNWIKKIEDVFIAEINDRKKMNKAINKHIAVLDYAEKALLVLYDADSGTSLFSFTTIIRILVGIASTSISLV